MTAEGAGLNAPHRHMPPKPLATRGAPLEGGGREPQAQDHSAKCVRPRARRPLTIAREDRTGGTVVRAILPQGPHAHQSTARGGSGAPPGGFLSWRGRLEGGFPGGEPRRGRRGTHFATATKSRGWAGGDSTRPRRGARRAHHRTIL